MVSEEHSQDCRKGPKPDMNHDMVELGAVSARIESHVESCESSKRMIFTAFGIALTINLSIVGFITSSLFEVKGRLDGVIARLDAMDRLLVANKVEFNDRILGVVGANTQREATFNDRFKGYDNNIDGLRRDIREAESRIDARLRDAERGYQQPRGR